VFGKFKLLRMACAVALSFCICSPVVVLAATTESAVKAGFIYNFSKFIEWPASTKLYTKFNICIVGDSRLEDGLDALEGKMVGNKPISVHKKISKDSLKNCQILFIAEDGDQETYALLHATGNAPVVTVSDSPEFILKGGMIGLIRNGSRVGFEVNLTPANAADIHFRAQLLKLAKNVRGLK
jgi:YfiR/HmsC-like